MTDKNFTLFKLPSLALAEILKLCSPFELLDLAQCSIKSAALIRCYGWITCKMSVDYQNYVIVLGQYFIYCCNETRHALLPETTKTFGEHVVPARCFNQNKMETFWRERATGMHTISLLILKLFKLNVSELLTTSLPFQWLDAYINMFSANNTVAERFQVNVFGIPVEVINTFLSKVRISKELRMFSEPESTINGRILFRNYPEMLRIGSSSWFTLEHLLAAGDCIRIALTESALTNRDLDVFIGKWKSGEFPNLQNLDITGDQLDNETPIVGLTPPILDPNNETRETKSIGSYYTATAQYTVNILRDTDGVKASLYMNARRPTQFEMIVWD